MKENSATRQTLSWYLSRSRRAQVMPGMMETVLNVGLTEKTIPGLVRQSAHTRFVYDAYQAPDNHVFGVVMEKAAGIERR